MAAGARNKMKLRQLIAPFIPNRFRPPARRIYEYVEYELGKRTGRRDPLRPPPWLHVVGSNPYESDFEKIGEEFFQHFVKVGGLQPDHRVLDVGSGTGRMARPLTRYLTKGSYEGIEIVGTSVRWCQRTYRRRYPNFHFQWSDIHNGRYNAAGKVKPSEYGFPFANASFDFVFLTSVFTHLLPPDLEHYLSEVARVLKKGGRSFATYYLLNEEAAALIEAGRSYETFKYDYPGCRVEKAEVPEAVVAYQESTILSLYRKYGVSLAAPVYHGNWCGRKNGLTWQDVIVGEKGSA